MKLNITPQETQTAKKQTQQLNQIKTHNKIPSNNNWIGLLGETKLHQLLTQHKIPHTWLHNIKNNWNDHDFTIQQQKIDLKTTYTNKLWIQKPVFDRYILAKINKENTQIKFIGTIQKKYLEEGIKNNYFEIVRRKYNNKIREDYVIPSHKLFPFKEYFEELQKKKDIRKTQQKWKQQKK